MAGSTSGNPRQSERQAAAFELTGSVHQEIPLPPVTAVNDEDVEDFKVTPDDWLQARMAIRAPAPTVLLGTSPGALDRAMWDLVAESVKQDVAKRQLTDAQRKEAVESELRRFYGEWTRLTARSTKTTPKSGWLAPVFSVVAAIFHSWFERKP